MAGVDSIVNEILREAKEKAERQLAEARAEADKKIAAAEQENADFLAKAAAKADEEAENVIVRAKSASGLRRRQALLVAKQDIIEGLIGKAYELLDQQPDGDYFSMIKKLLAKAVHSGDGEILFSEKDLKRLPETFAKEIAEIAGKSGGSLQISDKPAAIDNGFLLSYGGIDENCSLKALFAEKHDQLQDKAHASLW